MSEPTYDLMYDCTRRAVGCVLFQAAHGCDQSLLSRFDFDTNTWLTSPTPDLRKIRGTAEQWKAASKITAQVWRDKHAGRG